MDVLQYLIIGFRVALDPMNLLFCFLGCLGGTLVGVLPGFGPVAAMALLLPSTFHLSPVSAIIMLAGIYYGAMYGGSTTSILINIPGETASVVTCLDGYQMARKGRAGPALGMSAFASFIAGTIGVVGLMLLAPPLTRFALQFGPPEYFSLMFLGLTLVAYLAQGSMIKAFIMAALGLLIAFIGTDVVSGVSRFTYDFIELREGVGIIPILMGVFGVAEIFSNAEEEMGREVFASKIKGLLPTLKDWMDSKWALLRGSLVGFFLGILPGGGAVIASFVAYALEKRFSKHPQDFGTGIIEGVAGPESANNSATAGAFIPLLTLGIPGNAVTALLLGAFMIHGTQPGPLMMERTPELFWGIVASMYLGNIILLILNLPLIGIWVRVLKVPYSILSPLILLFCIVGAYSLNNSLWDIAIMIFFGVLGHVMKKAGFEGAPMILSLVIGQMFENAFRQSLLLGDGSFMIFIRRPISAVLVMLSISLIFTATIRKRLPQTIQQ
jgi:putative tricarboxylic transport membrane protein